MKEEDGFEEGIVKLRGPGGGEDFSSPVSLHI